MDQRLELLKDWLKQILGREDFAIAPASADASFRRYFRVSYGNERHIVMDAPPQQEDCRPFIQVSALLGEVGLNAPQVKVQDLDKGFLLLTDLGERTYLAELDNSSVQQLYADAIKALLVMQARTPATDALPPYDRTLLMVEMHLFRDWYVQRHLGLTLTKAEHKALEEAFICLADSALSQPQVMVHRDYHSRNLMICEPNPGILDFQDAVLGPVSYDLASLLRDCYVAWPRQQVEAWVMQYLELARDAGVIMRDVSHDTFLRWFDLMGVQRHLKASGIFARLNHRDGKPGYLKDIPRTLAYIAEVSPDHPELEMLSKLICRLTEEELVTSN